LAKHNNRLTVIVVPQTSKRSFSFTLAPAWLALFVILVAGLSGGVWYYMNQAQSLRTELTKLEEVEELRKTNRLQQAQIEEMQGKAQQVQARLAELELLEQQVRQLTGQGTDTTSRSGDQSLSNGGRGGPQDSPTRQENLPTLSALLPDEVRSYVLGRRDTLALDLKTGRGPAPNSRTLEIARKTNQALSDQLLSLDQSAEKLSQSKEDIIGQLEYLAHRPIGIPISGARITDRFGTRWSPFGWGRQEHNGIDFAQDYWTPIVATGAGVVTHAGWKSGGYGYAVMIDHGYGLVTLYAHMVDWNVKVGDTVSRGDVIGWVGNTGLSTGPHLHYEVHLEGVPVDPVDYLN